MANKKEREGEMEVFLLSLSFLQIGFLLSESVSLCNWGVFLIYMDQHTSLDHDGFSSWQLSPNCHWAVPTG